MTNPFTSYPFLATGATVTQPRKLPDRLLDVVNVKDYGALGDGSGDLLLSRYASLAAAQADYPGVESLSDTIDYAACMAALGWNSIFVEAASKVYSAAVRFTSLSWAAGTATAVTCVPHGLTTGDQIIHWFTGQSDGAEWSNNTGGGIFTVTDVIDSTTFTYPMTQQPGPAVVPVGCFTPVVASASRTSNVVTVDFSAPHRMISGLTVNMRGFPGSIDSSSHVITVTSPKQLTFSSTGSNGTLSVDFYAWVSMPARLVVKSWPKPPDYAPYNYYMAQEYPTNYAGNYLAQISDLVTANTITFGGATPTFFWNSIEADAVVRLQTASFGKIYFPPGEYIISRRLDLGHNGVSGIFYGSPGSSIIRGSLPHDYLMAQDRTGHGPARWEGLTFVNDAPTGGGLRLVASNSFVTACTFKCGDIGLTLANQDFRNAVAFDAEITGCIFLPNGSASVGLADASNNSSVYGNYFKGLASGINSQNFFHCTDGNLFVDCGVGYNGGINPFGAQGACNKAIMRGNAFSNCGVGLSAVNLAINRIEGAFIEGGADANYGLKVDTGYATIRGAHVTGDFSVVAVQSEQPSPARSNKRVVLRSIGAENSGAGDAWTALTVGRYLYDNCNVLPVYTYLNQSLSRAIAGLAYDSGTGIVTLTTDSTHYFTFGSGECVYVSGVKVSGSTDNSYNGIYPLLSISSPTLTYHVNVAPGTADANTGSVSTTSSVTTLGSSPTLKSVVWNPLSHKVEVETLVPHFMPKYGASANMVVMAGGSYTNPFNTGVYEPATVVDSTHFTYDLASDPVVTVDSGSLSTSRPSNTTSSASYFYSGVYLPNVLYDSIEGYSMGDISDGQKVGGGTANIGDLVTGGGSQHISVIWTQNGWMRRG